MSENLVNVKVDGIEVQVPKGTLAIRAAEQVGVFIPRFCDHPLLKPVAACRACLVEIASPGRDGEVRKMPKPQPACATQVSEGMEIYTQMSSEVSAKAQEGVMELLLVNHPLDCPVCDKGGECPLQNQALSAGRGDSRFTDYKRVYPKPLRLTSEVLLDRERCILCQRCVRFGKEIAGDAFLDLQGRGGGSSPIDPHYHMGEQIGSFDTQVLGFADPDSNPNGCTLTAAEGLSSPAGTPGVIGTMNSGTTSPDQEDVSGRRFSSYFSGNVIQICPVGALTSATYRFRARPFDLISTPSVTDQDASGAAIRVDARRGKVTRQLAGEDPEVNREWISDKDRFGFPWQTSPDRLTNPLVRNAEGKLVETSWHDALERAAKGIKAAREDLGVSFMPGGHLTLEDYLAWAKFARIVGGTNDIDCRARKIGREENDLVRAQIAGNRMTVTYADLDKAPQVLLVGLEPEDECATVFLRLRAANLNNGTKVATVAPFASAGTRKMNAALIMAAPGEEARALAGIWDTHRNIAEGLQGEGSVILIGERAAEVPGLITAARRLAQNTGAKIAWIPRRVGERAGVEAGCWPGLLPGGRLSSDAQARADLAAIWGVDSVSDVKGGCVRNLWSRSAEGKMGALVLGGVDLRDVDPTARAAEALEKVSFVVQLEVRRSAVTEYADVVLPVAPPHEKNGTFVNWEGRLRPFGQALASRQLPDWAVLNRLAKVAGYDLGYDSLKAIHAEWAQLADWQGQRGDFRETEPESPEIPAGSVRLATWKPLLDSGRCQDGEPYLAATARRPIARVSANTAASFNLGEAVKVETEKGMITLPVVVTEMPDGAVWVPQCSPGSTVIETLGVSAGAPVTLSAAEVKA